MRFAFLTVVAFTCSAVSVSGAEVPLDFNRDVKPILSKNCFACHGPDEGHRSAGLRLDLRDAAVMARKKGAAIVPNKSANSRIIHRIIEADAEQRMPPPETGNVLTPEQVSILKRWIDEGANYSEHWAFVKPKRPAVPSVKQIDWAKNEIDRFILAQLEAQNLKPSAPADRFVLLRRASLDLRGLPPSPEEVEMFARDTSPNAYEKMLDRFLADPAYGERWARVWLDLARYADSAGYGSDPLRPNMWRYRDWVIDAFNKNKPYDQFTIEQIAGDLLSGATLEQKMATAFHRNTMTNTEGGTDDEEFRVVAVKDRVDTTTQVWMGLTLGCAKCHSHKFDPISQKEYYRFYALFNQTADNDRGDESPTIPAPTPELQEQLKIVEARLAELRKQLDQPSAELTAEQKKWEATLRLILDGKLLEVAKKQPSTDPMGDTLTLSGKTAATNATAFRLDFLPGNAARTVQLNRFSVTTGEASKSPRGRIVRVDLPGPNQILALAEVQVFRGGKNVALKAAASQSSTAYEGPANLAVDGNTNGHYYESKSVTHTGTEANPWWEVKLPETGEVEKIAIWNRTDGGAGSRLNKFRVSLLDDDRKVVWSKEVQESPNPSLELALGGVQVLTFADAFTSDFSAVTPQGVWAPVVDKTPLSSTFILPKEIALPAGTPLTVTLNGKNLGEVKIQVLQDARLAQRLAVPAAVRQALDVAEAKRTPAQSESVAKHYRTLAPGLKTLRDQIAQLEKTRPEIPTLPVMQELPEKQRRKTKLMIKGDFLNLGEEVQPGIPTAFHALPAGAPLDRLGVAQWIVSPENPLTARVAVNRLWSQLFGKGLVETEEDFGTQGELPTHPELLDFLATEYVRLKWDTKAILKQMLLSSTYQQSAKVTPELLAKDPKNRLLSRSPRFRLEAEMVRDQALYLGGLLSRKIGGPSVYPPQPDGLWQAAFNGQRTYPTSTGEDKNRRGLYTFWRRTVPYPSMTTFDAPSRETCAIRRIRTNTPLQAFVTLNDPVYVEAAQGLARRILKEGGSTTPERMQYALRLVLCRPAQSNQVQPLIELHQQELARFQKDPKSAKSLATVPLGPLPMGQSEPETAAWTVIANVLLNLDSVLTK